MSSVGVLAFFNNFFVLLLLQFPEDPSVSFEAFLGSIFEAFYGEVFFHKLFGEFYDTTDQIFFPAAYSGIANDL